MMIKKSKLKKNNLIKKGFKSIKCSKIVKTKCKTKYDTKQECDKIDDSDVSDDSDDLDDLDDSDGSILLYINVTTYIVFIAFIFFYYN